MTLIDEATRTVKRVSDYYVNLCKEANIIVRDAHKARLTEDDLLRFINVKYLKK